MTIRICGEGKEVMGMIEDGQPDGSKTHGICPSCMKKNHRGAYYMSRRNEINERLAAFDASQGIADMNAYFFQRSA